MRSVVVKTRCDRRTFEAEPRPEVHRRLVEGRDAWLEGEVALARDFAAILESRHYRLESCATFQEYAQRLGYDGQRAFVLARFGQSLLNTDWLEADVRSGAIRLECALVLPEALGHEKVAQAADWQKLARELDPKSLKRHVKHVREQVAQEEEQLRLLSFLVTDKVRDDWRRLYLSMRAQLRDDLTEGQAFGILVREGLEAHDPVIRAKRRSARRAKRKARKAEKAANAVSPDEPTRACRRSRHIPNELYDALKLRSQGRCEVGGCTYEGPVEIMHLVPFADGGPHDLRNIADGCPGHHRLYDMGRLECIGFNDEERPIFRNDQGEVHYPDPRPPPLEGGEETDDTVR